MKRRAKYDRKGMLAMRPEAFGLDFLFFEPEARAPFELVGDTAIVRIEGPLTHHEDWWCDSYDGIIERMGAALASKALNVLMVIDSPGGDCSGCFETSRELRKMAAAAGKPLASYIEGMGASGGYAIACAGSKIYASETAMVGSIGVIVATIDVTAQDAMFGEKFTIISSGARKADGNPHTPLTDEARSAVQANVDALAELFFKLVGESRQGAGLSADAARGLQAAIVVGEMAIDKRLVDSITTRSALLQSLTSASDKTSTGRSAATSGKANAMGWKSEMEQAAKDGDEEAKKCVDALDEAPPSKDDKGDKKEEKTDAADGDGKEKDGDGKEKEKTAEEPPKKDGDGEGDKKEAARAAAGAKVDAVIDAAVEERVNARLRPILRPIELKAVLDERVKADPFMPEAFKKHCMTLAGAAELRALLNVTPTFPRLRNDAPTQGREVLKHAPGGSEATASDGLQGDELAAMNKAMGIEVPAEEKPGVDADGIFRLHVVKPTKHREQLAKRAGGK